MYRGRGRSLQILWSSERGGAFVEAALVTPLMMILFLGVAQFGVAFGILGQLRGASAVGARAAVLGTNSTHVQVCDAARSAVAGALDVSQIVCQTSPETLPAPANTRVTVTLRYPFHFLFPEGGSILNLSAQTTMQ